MLKGNKIILASSSRSRRKILNSAGVQYRSIKPFVDEESLKKGFKGSTKKLALMLAEKKALSVSKKYKNTIIIGADQVLSFKGKVFNKPKTIKEAEKNFKLFRNKTHYLDSATVIAYNDKIIWRNEQSPKMKVRNFSDKFLKNYLKTNGASVTYSAGGYSIEKDGVQMFSKVEGDFFTIIGLPILPLLEKLRKLNSIAVIK
jgi:septum formation protein